MDAGATYTVGLRPLSEDLSANLQLISPSGAVVENVSERGRDGELLIPGIIAESGDPYTVIVTGLDETTGDYVISYGRGSTRADVRQAETFPDRSYDAVMRRRGGAAYLVRALRAGRHHQRGCHHGRGQL